MDRPKVTISILISRNYDGVKRCLDSVRPIMEAVSSELILTDTGCGEEVRRLIEGYSDHIIDFEWIKDFSAARNVGLKEAKGEWFLYIDDDEWFEDTSELIQFFNSGECDRYNVATYIQRNYLDIEGKTYADQSVDRIIRITPQLHFEHRVHEAYTGIEIGRKKRLNTYANHFGYVYKSEEERLAKSLRNRELLMLECREHPDDMRMRHQLVMDCYGVGQYDEAIEEALDGIKIKSDSMYWDALHTDMLFCLQGLKRWEDIITYGKQFLGDNLFPYDEFGVRQYMICAYWSLGRHADACSEGEIAIKTYIDYKKNPDKYDANQIMREEFWQPELISKMLIFIIDSALATCDSHIIDMISSHALKDELSTIKDNDTYRTWLVSMVSATCISVERIELLDRLPFGDIIDLQAPASAPIVEIDSLEFEPSFFEGETRQGFYIEPLVKNTWAAQLETLHIFDKICEANDLTYSMDWGSLLGAVRHRGYIPWDDDLDVCMMREDIRTFMEIIPSYPRLTLVNQYNTPDFGLHAYRLNLSVGFTVERGKLKDYYGFPFPVGIDIFCVDYVPRDNKLQGELYELMLSVNIAIECLEHIEAGEGDTGAYHKRYLSEVNKLRQLGGIEFSEDEPGYQELTILYDEIEGSFTDADADYISEFQCMTENGTYHLPKDTYKKLIRVPFENMMVPIPANFDEVISVKYGGTCMVPSNIRGGHDYPFFKAAIEEITSRNGGSYEDNKAHIERISTNYYLSFLNRTTDTYISYEEGVLDARDINPIQAALIEVLQEVDRLCGLHSIRYYYVGGTEVEIDDIRGFKSDSTDIHLAMYRSDYMHFQQIIQEELDPWYDYRSIYSYKDHTDPRTYIITDPYKTDMDEYKRRFHGCEDIVGIDIAPIDSVSDDDSVEALKSSIIAQLMQGSYNMPDTGPYSDEILALVDQWEMLLDIEIDRSGNLKNELIKAADSVAMSDASDTSKRVRISSDIYDGQYRLYERSDFEV